LLKKICDCVYNYETDKIAALVNEALAAGIPAREIMNEGLMKGMEVVGESFKEGDYFVPEVLMAAKTMGEGLEIIKPLLLSDSGGVTSRGKVVIGTVHGDLHDIGKKLVKMFIESAGYEVFDIGIDIPAEQFVEKAKELNADFLCMSAMLTTTMKEMKVIVDLMSEAGIKDKVKPVIGGASCTQKFADEIGSFFAFDAGSAVELLKKLS